MSTAWVTPVVLLREPRKAVANRILGRMVLPAIILWLTGVPGTPWTGAIPWLWLRIPVFALGIVAVLLWIFAILNAFVNKRVVLRCMPTGSLERPKSLQERILRIPQEYAIGPIVKVTPEPAQFMSHAEPRVTLAGTSGTVRRISLWGTPAEDFLADVNTLLHGRGITLVLEEAPEHPALADDDASGEGGGGGA